MYLDGFGKFLVIFVQKYFFFYPCLKILGQKITFWRFRDKFLNEDVVVNHIKMLFGSTTQEPLGLHKF